MQMDKKCRPRTLWHISGYILIAPTRWRYFPHRSVPANGCGHELVPGRHRDEGLERAKDAAFPIAAAAPSDCGPELVPGRHRHKRL